MKNRINLFLLVILFATGCTTKLVREGGTYQKAQWETKALINDLKTKKSQSLTIDILAIKNERARFEISALLGYRVASLAMSPSQISYIVYPQKRFYYGRNSERAFARMLDLPLHPMNLTHIAFDEPIRGRGWQCQLDVAGQVSACENLSRQLMVRWTERTEGTKKVLISGPQFEMQWYFSAPQTEVQFKSETFTLRQPEGFKAIQLN